MRGTGLEESVPLSLNSLGSSRLGLMLRAEEVLEVVDSLSLSAALGTPLGSVEGEAPSS